MEIEKINIEEVYGEPIDENDTIFKVSNSGKKAQMYCIDHTVLDFYKLCELKDNEHYDFYELTTRINNDRHEGRINLNLIEDKIDRTLWGLLNDN